MNRWPLVLALLFAACSTHPPKPAPHDTAALRHNLTTARALIVEATHSAVTAGGHIKAARDLGTQADAKDEIIEKWIQALDENPIKNRK